METIDIQGMPRTDLGKKATRALRRAGNIPCNIYGGSESVNFYGTESSFRKLIYSPDYRLAAITIDGKTRNCIVKEIQSHPVTDAIQHIDFQELVENNPVRVSLPLRLTGTPKGQAMGGKLEQSLRSLVVSCLPKHLVGVIEVDVTDMDLGSIKRVRDIQVDGIQIITAAAMPIAKMPIPRAAKEAATEAAKSDKK